jgi:hypothetical protein
MPHALNFAVRIKQDPATLAELAKLKQDFATTQQPLIDEAVRKSQIVHFARIVVLDDKYLLVLTEYDGTHEEYAEFFRLQLGPLFKHAFSLIDNPPDWDKINNQRDFFEISKTLQVRSLGTSTRGERDFDGKVEGYLFSAYDGLTVKEILPKIDK